MCAATRRGVCVVARAAAVSVASVLQCNLSACAHTSSFSFPLPPKMSFELLSSALRAGSSRAWGDLLDEFEDGAAAAAPLSSVLEGAAKAVEAAAAGMNNEFRLLAEESRDGINLLMSKVRRGRGGTTLAARGAGARAPSNCARQFPPLTVCPCCARPPLSTRRAWP